MKLNIVLRLLENCKVPSTLKLSPATLKALRRRRVAGHAPAPVPQFFSCYGCRAELLFYFDRDAFSEESRSRRRCFDISGAVPRFRSSRVHEPVPGERADRVFVCVEILCVVAAHALMRLHAIEQTTEWEHRHADRVRRRVARRNFTPHWLRHKESCLENHHYERFERLLQIHNITTSNSIASSSSAEG